MTSPLTLQEQKKLARFVVDVQFAFYYSAGVLNKVWKVNKEGQVEQAAHDIPQAAEDIQDFKEAMKKYGIVDSGPINPESGRAMYDLQDPTWKHLSQVRMHLRKRLINEPKRNFLIFYIFACHGI